MRVFRILHTLLTWSLVTIATGDPVSTIRNGMGNDLMGSTRTVDDLTQSTKNENLPRSVKANNLTTKTNENLTKSSNADTIHSMQADQISISNSTPLLGVINENDSWQTKATENLTKIKTDNNLTESATENDMAKLAAENDKVTETSRILVDSGSESATPPIDSINEHVDRQNAVQSRHEGYGVYVSKEACPCNQCDDFEDSGWMCTFKNSTEVTIRGKMGRMVNIQCNTGTTFSCEDIPRQLAIGMGESIGLNLRFCSIPSAPSDENPFSCLSRRLGARSFAALTLYKLTDDAQLTPDMMKGLEDVEALSLTYEKKSATVSFEALSNLPKLAKLSVNSASLVLHPDDFLSTSNLTRLELSNASIKNIPEGVFRPLNKLKKLSLWGNSFEEFTEKQLEGLTSLEELDITSCHVTSLAGLIAVAPPLRLLNAFNNNFVELPPLGVFASLEMLMLHDNRAPLSVAPGALAGLAKLKTVDLSRSGIQALHDDTFAGCTALTRLQLSGNKLKRLPLGIFRTLSALGTLDLSRNLIESIQEGLFFGLAELKTLNLDRNKLISINDRVFAGLSSIRSLSIRHNQVAHIARYGFSRALSVQELYLDHNNITQKEVDGQQYSLFDVAFNSLVNVRVLDLSHNALKTPPTGIALIMVALERLDLSYNNITELNDNDVGFSSEAEVDMSHNQIRTMRLGYGPTSAGSQVEDQSRRATVLLEDNPFDCDCKNYNFVHRLKGFRPVTVEANFDVGNAECSSPSHLKGLKVQDISLRDLACTLNNTDPELSCVNDCECVIRPYTNALELTCPDIPENFPSLSYFKQAEIELTLTKSPPFVDIDKDIRMLNLSGLSMTDIAVENLPPRLEMLDISGNNLTRIPVELFNVYHNNMTLRMSKNNFQCECWNAESVKLVKDNFWRIEDYESVNCSTSWIGEVNVKQLCSTFKAATIGGVFVGLGVVAVIIAVIILKYNLEIKVWLYNKGWFTRWLAIDDEDRKYDAFVSFCHKDQDFILDHLMPGLEGQPRPYKICVHYRDWIPGEFITTQIVRSVADSRRTIIVVSRNFLESMWGLAELKVAIGSALKEGKTRLIVILLEDIDTKEIDGDLKAYISTNTYLKWGDPWFWDKLRYALPHRRPVAAKARKYAKANLAKENIVKTLEKSSVLDTRLTPDGKIINAAAVNSKQKNAGQILDVANLENVKIDGDNVANIKKVNGNELVVLKNFKVEDNDMANLKTLTVNK